MNVMKRFGIVVLILFGISTGVYYWTIISPWQRPVDIHLYGTSADPAMRRIEDVLREVRMHFGNRVRVTPHYLALRDQEGAFLSLEVRRPGLAPTPEYQQFDLAENARRLVMLAHDREKFWRYVAFRNDAFGSYAWEVAALAAGYDPTIVEADVTADGPRLQQAEIAAYEAFVARRQEAIVALPQLFVNDTLYTGMIDLQSLSSAVTRVQRDGGTSSLYGIARCASDLHCDDRPDMDGTCERVRTRDAQCVYRPPVHVNLVVFVKKEYTEDTDLTVEQMRRNFKSLSVIAHNVREQEGAALARTLRITSYPAYFFDESIEEDSRLGALLAHGIVREQQDGWYALLMNHDQASR